MRITIEHGCLFDPAGQLDGQHDLYIADGTIVGIKHRPDGFTSDLQIDAKGKLVLPGLVDLCARLREPGQVHKATFQSECRAANSSGITSICCPPDTQPVIDSTAVVDLIHQRTRDTKRANIYPLAALTVGLQGQQLSEMDTLQRSGCIGVGNALAPIASAEVLRRAFEYAHSCGLTVFLFAEDHALRKQGGVHEGAISTRLGLPAIPEAAETVALSRALLFVEQTQVKTHFCRLSSARGVRMIAMAQEQGLPVSADVAVCNLHLTEMDIADYNSNCHLQPPLRNERDRQGLLKGIKQGVITAVCSDHQPHDADAKAAPFSQTEAGASTIEHLLPLMLHLVKRKELTLEQAIGVLTSQPAAILGIDKGTLAVGRAADICILDMELSAIVDAATLLSAGKNTPFKGWELPGQVTHTLYNGAIVFNQD